MKCPDCNGDMVLRETRRFHYPKNGRPRKFYGCENYPTCRATHGAHPDGRPLGTPGDTETKQWRIKAHDAMRKCFGKMNRKKQYKLLQQMMCLSEEDAHIGKFDINQCKNLIELLKKFTQTVKHKPNPSE